MVIRLCTSTQYVFPNNARYVLYNGLSAKLSHYVSKASATERVYVVFVGKWCSLLVNVNKEGGYWTINSPMDFQVHTLPIKYGHK